MILNHMTVESCRRPSPDLLSGSAENREQLKRLPHIAIAGASGRVGGAIRRFSLIDGQPITALQHRNSVPSESLKAIIKGFDITTRDKVFRTVQQLARNDVKIIINATGVLSVDKSEKERGKHESPMYQVHVVGAKNLAEACRANGIKMIHLSTEYIFTGDKPDEEKYDEDESPNTTRDGSNKNPTWYGLTKALGEQKVIKAFQDIPEDLVIARIAQVQVPNSGLFAATLKQIRENTEFTRVNNQLASPITDATVVEALHQIEQRMLDPEKTMEQIYHIGATDALTPYDICLEIAEKSGFGDRARAMQPVTLEQLVARGEQSVIRPKNTTLGVARFVRDFGKLPTISQEIQRYLKLYTS